jgi:hypothetical protein
MRGRSRYLSVVTAAGTAFLVVAAMTGSAAAKPKPTPTPTPTSWDDPLCYVEGGPWGNSPQCQPPSVVPQPPPTAPTCEGAVFCQETYAQMEAAGFDTTQMRANDQAILAGLPMPTIPSSASAATSTTFNNAWLNFYLYYKSNCTGTVNDNGYCGWLYHKYIVLVDGVQKGGVHTSSYPGRSGNNNPDQMWTPNTGPQPRSWGSSKPSIASGSWRWGWRSGNKAGYETDTSESYYPGKWPLDPWRLWKGSGQSGTERDYFLIHGGSGPHEFKVKRTEGCIRLPSNSVTSLKSMWNNYTDNKWNPYANLWDYYS